MNEFKRGRTSTKNIVRDRILEVTTPEMIDKIHDMVLSEVKVCELVEVTGLLLGFNIDEKLGMKTISARCAFAHTGEYYIRNHVVESMAGLALFCRYPDVET